MAIFILALAWTIGEVCSKHLQLGPWIISRFSPGPNWIPVIMFVVSSLIALATGTSFGTMAIVIPIAAQMAWVATGDASGLSENVVWSIRYSTLASVLTGAVFGDHCSPISDTTVMSSMAAASDHVDHVKTQAPYAILVAAVAGIVGFIPAGFGVSPIFSILAGFAILVAFMFIFGRRAEPALTT